MKLPGGVPRVGDRSAVASFAQIAPRRVRASAIRSEAASRASAIRSAARCRERRPPPGRRRPAPGALPSGHRRASLRGPSAAGSSAIATSAAVRGAGVLAPGAGDLATTSRGSSAAPYVALSVAQENATTSRIDGMLCPRCHSSTRVLESRRAPDGAAVRRRRECGELRPSVHHLRAPRAGAPRTCVKRDGERQRFDRTKLRASLLGAAHKRPVSPADVESLVERVELAARSAAASCPRSGSASSASPSCATSTAAPTSSSPGPCLDPPSRPDLAAVAGGAGSVRAAREDAESTR